MALAQSLDGESAALHVGIILDGNGRWARARGLPRTAGHRRGAEVVRTILKGCPARGVRYLTIYAFSSENWKRPVGEVEDLMGLLRLYLRREVADLRGNGVRIAFIGDRARLSAEINDLIREAEESTRHNAELTLTVALNYGGPAGDRRRRPPHRRAGPRRRARSRRALRGGRSSITSRPATCRTSIW